jgi:hypothetical protein
MNPELVQEILLLRGRAFSAADIAQLRQCVDVPDELANILTSVPIAGVQCSLEADASGMSVAMEWMTLEHTLSEATEAYPGKLASKRGYVPIGDCLMGSGDPYFYRNEDGAVVRIPHDAAASMTLNENMVELVATSVEQLLLTSTLSR